MHIAERVFWSSIFFLLGVALASIGVGLWIASLGAGALFVILRDRGVCRWSQMWLIAVVFLGMLYYQGFVNLHSAQETFPLSRAVTFSGNVINDPEIFGSVQQAAVSLAPPWHDQLTLSTDLDPILHYGDRIQFEGTVEPAENPDELPEVSFPRYVDVIQSGNGGFFLQRWLLVLKHAFVNRFDYLLPHEEAALLSGIIFGWRSNFPKDLQQAIQQTEAQHLVVFSGYKLSLLLFALSALLSRFFTRRATFWLATVSLVMCVMIVGASSAVLRAAVMSFLALWAQENGRVYTLRNVMAMTALIMVLLNPAILWFDAGFQISFVSVIGIVVFNPVFERWLRFEGKGAGALGWRENLTLTLAVQSAILPLLLWHFQEFTILGIAPNVLLLGFVPLTIVLGLFVGAAAFVSSSFALLMALPLDLLMKLQIATIFFFSKISLPISGSFLTYSAVGLYGIYLLRATRYLSKQER